MCRWVRTDLYMYWCSSLWGCFTKVNDAPHAQQQQQAEASKRQRLKSVGSGGSVAFYTLYLSGRRNTSEPHYYLSGNAQLWAEHKATTALRRRLMGEIILRQGWETCRKQNWALLEIALSGFSFLLFCFGAFNLDRCEAFSQFYVPLQRSTTAREK